MQRVKNKRLMKSEYFKLLGDDKGIDVEELIEGEWNYYKTINTILVNVRDNMIMGGNDNWVDVDTITLSECLVERYLTGKKKKTIDFMIKRALEMVGK